MTSEASAPPQRGLGEILFAAGIGVFLVGGIATAVLAARELSPADYTVYAAFSAVFGVVVLGPAGALEQRSAQLGGRGLPTGQGLRRLRTPMLVVWAVVAAAALLAPGSWRDSYFAGATSPVMLSLLLITPAALLAAVLRGFATGQHRYVLVASANAATGIAMLGLSLGLILLGVDPLVAFVYGPVVAWLLPLAFLGAVTILRPSTVSPVLMAEAAAGGATSAWLIAANLLMIANLLAVPAILRSHAGSLPEATVASAQLVVSTSRLITTAALAFLPLLIARLSRLAPEELRRSGRMLAVAGAGLSALAVLVMLPVVGPALSWLTRGSVSAGPLFTALAAGPIVVLIPTFAMMAVAITRSRERFVAVGWLLGLVSLLAVAVVDVGGRDLLLLALVGACTLPPLLLTALGAFGRSRTADDASDAALPRSASGNGRR